MTVFVVLQEIDYSGDTILGIYAVREVAEAIAREKTAAEKFSQFHYRVEVWLVNRKTAPVNVSAESEGIKA